MAISNIRLVVTDFDGVHTDNRVFVFQDGAEAVLCTRADGQACGMMRALGVEVVIVSTESNAVVSARAAKLGVKCIQGCVDKGSAVRQLLKDRGLRADEVVYVGNDVNDLPAMQEVRWTVAPADAHPTIQMVVTHVSKCRGGAGVLRDLVDISNDGTVPWRF